MTGWWWRIPYPARALVLLPGTEAAAFLGMAQLGAGRTGSLIAALVSAFTAGVFLARAERRHHEKQEAANRRTKKSPKTRKEEDPAREPEPVT